jgi:ABC-type nitrate/sulfonate/bicarbonate transport system substrate-binding protein
MTGHPLHIGFIPLVDAASLIVAVDKGFAKAEGLDGTLVREVSWSNIRDKLNIGMFDAAHLLAPVAIASSLGLGHVKVPIVVPFTLNLNGNAITVSPALHSQIAAQLNGGDIADPLATAQALARLVAARRADGAEPLVFGMTFPFSTHNYQLRFWMAAGGVDPDEDVQLVVLPPPFMVDSLASGHVDGFCVGAPWNAVAVDRGIGRILHFGPDILSSAAEKVLAVRSRWADEQPGAIAALVRAHQKAAEFIEQPGNRNEVSALLARPDRVDADAEIIRSVLEGRLVPGRGAAPRASTNYISFARNGAARPDPAQAAWLYAQMVRWGQAALGPEALNTARAVFRPDLYDAALGLESPSATTGDAIGAFAGPAFDPVNIELHLAAFEIANIRG